MENKKIKKTTLAIILISVLGVLSIAYAALSTTLTIQSGSDTQVDPWVVQFNNDTSNGINAVVGAPVNATGGTVAVSSAAKTNDTVTISGTKLHDYGAEVIYKLQVLNKGTKKAYLQAYPTIDREQTVNSDVEIGLYTDETCQTLVAKNNEIAAATNSTTPGTVDWYVKVSYKAYGSESGKTTTALPTEATDFSFSMSPEWAATPAS